MAPVVFCAFRTALKLSTISIVILLLFIGVTPAFAERSPSDPALRQALSANQVSFSNSGVVADFRNHLPPSNVAAQLHSSLFNDTTWHRHVDAPDSPLLTPRAIIPEYTKGAVTGAGALVGGSKGPATLARWNESDEEPVIVLDFGRNVVGLVVIQFEGSTRTKYSNFQFITNEDDKRRPGLRLSFSETLEYLADRSDFSRSYNIGNKHDKITNGSDQIAVSSYPSTWESQAGCQYPSTKQVCSDGLHGFRYLRISLSSLLSDAPYTQSLGEVRIQSVQLRLSAYLGTPDTFRGWFECSDPDLTKYWYQGVYTNDLCTDEFRANDTEPRNAVSPSLLGKTVLLDGAKRDRDPYVGDLAVSGLTAYLTRDYADAVSNVLEDLAEYQREDGWIPPASILGYNLHLFDYPLWWVVCVFQHVLYTGNASFAVRMYPAVQKVLDNYYPGTTNETLGLLQKGMGMHASEGYGDYAFLPRKGVVTYYNTLYALALRNAADLSTHPAINNIKPEQQQQDGSRWQGRADSVSAALASTCWDVSAGVFWDGQCDESTWCTTHAQDGNSLALLSGVVALDSESARSILSHFTKYAMREWGNAFYDSETLGKDFPDRVYPFISHFEVSSRFMVPGFAPSALDQLRRTYGTMLRSGPGTFWEGIGKQGRPYEGGFTSMAHGWSTGVVSSLTGKLLGVEPAQYGWGWERWRLRPLRWEAMVGAENSPSDWWCEGCDDKFKHIPVTWAKGVVPTPKGNIAVWWNMTESESKNPEQEEEEGEEKGFSSTRKRFMYTISISAPAGTVGEIWVPIPGKKKKQQDYYGSSRDDDEGDGDDVQSIISFTKLNGQPSDEIVKVELSKEQADDDDDGYHKVGLAGWGGDNLVHVYQVQLVSTS